MKEKMDIKQLIQKIGVTRFIVIVLAGIALLVLSLPSGSLTGSATADNLSLIHISEPTRR